MAKLNGVNVVVPAQAEKITYNGAEYVKTDADAKVGDIIRIGEESVSYVKDGAFYEVVKIDNDDDIAVFIDEDGDEVRITFLDETPDVFAKVEALAAADTVVHNGVTYRKVARKVAVGDVVIVKSDGYHSFDDGTIAKCVKLDSSDGVHRFEADGNDQWLRPCDYTVLEEVTPETLASAHSAPTTAKLPSTLPEGYVIHEGAVYRKESRKAKEGEKILVTAFDNGNHIDSNPAKNGSVFSAVDVDSDGDVSIDFRHLVYLREYAVLVPTDTVTIGGGLDGRKVEYTLEKRKATVGESVLVLLGGFFRPGDIFTNEQEFPVGNAAGLSNGKNVVEFDTNGNRKYLVLVPKSNASTTPTYTEVKRKASVGERIRIVAAVGAGGKYANGDEGTVTYTNSAGVFFDANGGNYGAYHSEYVVLEDAKPTQPEPAAASGISVGDTVTLVKGGDHPLYGFKDGETVKVTSLKAPYHGDKPIEVTGDCGRTGYTTLDNVKPVKSAKQPEPKADRLKVGDYARVTEKCFEYKAGDIVKIAEKRSNGCFDFRVERVGDNDTHYADESFLVRATDAEVAAAKRKNVKVGDYVRITGGDVTRRERGSHDIKVGTIVKVRRVFDDTDRVISVWKDEEERDHSAVSSADFEPVTAAEAEAARQKAALDAKQAEEAAAKAAETAKWSAIGRKVGEFKAGDIVSGVAIHRGMKRKVGAIRDISTELFGIVPVGGDTDFGYTAIKIEGAELIAPVESLFTAN